MLFRSLIEIGVFRCSLAIIFLTSSVAAGTQLSTVGTVGMLGAGGVTTGVFLIQALTLSRSCCVKPGAEIASQLTCLINSLNSVIFAIHVCLFYLSMPIKKQTPRKVTNPGVLLVDGY